MFYPWEDALACCQWIDLLLTLGGLALVPNSPETCFCLGEGLPCLLSSTKPVLLSGGLFSPTASKMDSVKQLFWSTHWFSRPIFVGSGVETCSFPLGLVFQKLWLARIRFFLATQWCTNLSHPSSHSHGLVTTGKISDLTGPLVLYFLTPPFQNLHFNKCRGLSFDFYPLILFLSLRLMVPILRLLKSTIFVGEVATSIQSLHTAFPLFHLEIINNGGYLQVARGTKLINFIFW